MLDEKRAIKESFSKVKKDIFMLGEEVSQIRNDIFEIKDLIKNLDNSINALKIQNLEQDMTSTDNFKTSTHPATSTDTSTHPVEIQGSKYPNLNSSIGNEGASTDRQTHRQTDNSTHITQESEEIDETQESKEIPESDVPMETEEESYKPIDQSISEASEILNNLDGLKKEIRIQFKSLTQQEMLVFSTIYQLEEQGDKDIDYKGISLKLGLSQSSIRDYVQRIMNKGIPIHKTKLNNKKIILSISKELKKIASLNTILKLREI